MITCNFTEGPFEPLPLLVLSATLARNVVQLEKI